MKNLKWLLLLCIVPAYATAAELKPVTIARCGESNGFAYYADGKIVPTEKAGWQKDGISGGWVELIRQANGAFDLLYYDRSGSVRSSINEGAVILLAFSNDRELSVNIRYSEASEIYTFWADRRGKLQYALLQSKATVALTKQALFVGQCSEINFRRAAG